MEEVSSLEASLESAFDGPAATPAKAPPAPVEATESPEAPEVADPVVEEAEEVVEAAEEEAEDTAGEPEFEIEIDGQVEVVRGKDAIKELLQKGRDYTKKTQEASALREALTIRAQQHDESTKFQTYAMPLITELQAADQRIAEYAKIDIAAMIETDFMQAMKVQQQKAQLKEYRDSIAGRLNQAVNTFKDSQAKAAMDLNAAEEKALLTKLPEWRNSEKATAEKKEIVSFLLDRGYTQPEISSLQDHRSLLLARDAMQWRKLQQGKTDKLKQVRQAPPVVKPGAKVSSADQSTANFKKGLTEIRKAGRQGNHRAQEDSLVRLLNGTFK